MDLKDHLRHLLVGDSSSNGHVSSSGAHDAFASAAQQHQHARRRLLEEGAQTPHVLGVGLGIFLLAFFTVLSLVICLVGSRARKPGIFYAAGLAMFAVVAGVLLGSPKGAAPPPPPPGGYDRGLVPLAVTGALLALGACGGAAGVFAYFVHEPVYARPLSYHADVLGQR